MLSDVNALDESWRTTRYRISNSKQDIMFRTWWDPTKRELTCKIKEGEGHVRLEGKGLVTVRLKINDDFLYKKVRAETIVGRAKLTFDDGTNTKVELNGSVELKRSNYKYPEIYDSR